MLMTKMMRSCVSDTFGTSYVNTADMRYRVGQFVVSSGLHMMDGIACRVCVRTTQDVVGLMGVRGCILASGPRDGC
jgi:hypothetical protein